MKACITTLFVSLVLNQVVCADEAEDTIKESYTAACKNTVHAAVIKLKPYLAKYAEFGDDREFAFLMPAADFNVYVDFEKKEVFVPVMWCIEMWYTFDAQMQQVLGAGTRQDVINYMNYLSWRRKEALKDGFFDIVPLKSFNEYSGVGRAEVTSEVQNSALAGQELSMTDATVFVIAHEIGHLVRNHKHYSKISPSESREQEYMADQFATDLLDDAGISLIPSLSVIMSFLTNEMIDAGTVEGVGGTHPRAVCRFVKIFLSSGEIDDLEKDPIMKDQLEKTVGMPVAQYRDELRQIRHMCVAEE